jgi:hypothetical protein
LFAIVGVARERAASSASRRQRFDAPGQRVALAQALAYNAHPQRPHRRRIDLTCQRIIPIRQAAAGWDLLAWSLPHGKGPFEYIGKISLLDPREFPRVRTNWQSKLTPLSVSMMARVETDELLPVELRRYLSLAPQPVAGSLLNH